jgi:hypothetical protein
LTADRDAIHWVPLDLHTVFRLRPRSQRGSGSKRRGAGGRNLHRGFAAFRHSGAAERGAAVGRRTANFSSRKAVPPKTYYSKKKNLYHIKLAIQCMEY